MRFSDLLDESSKIGDYKVRIEDPDIKPIKYDERDDRHKKYLMATFFIWVGVGVAVGVFLILWQEGYIVYSDSY